MSSMVVTDEQVAALRAYLVPDLGEAERLNQHLVTMGGQDGYGHFVYAAFVEAARNRFSPAWTRADVIRFVATVRKQTPGGQNIDPHAGEILIRRALGDHAADALDEETRGTVQVILLAELIAGEQLDGAGLDQFLAAARAQADMLLASRT
jgi:hypothetical protein